MNIQFYCFEIFLIVMFNKVLIIHLNILKFFCLNWNYHSKFTIINPSVYAYGEEVILCY